MIETLLPFFIPILVGGGMTFAAVFLWVRTRAFLNAAQKTQGVITQMIYRRSSKGGGSYLPEYSFKTLEGQQITVRDNLSSNPPMFQVGQQIEVLYDPQNPQNARINKWMNLYFLPALFGFLGITFDCVGIILVTVNLFSSGN